MSYTAITKKQHDALDQSRENHPSRYTGEDRRRERTPINLKALPSYSTKDAIRILLLEQIYALQVTLDEARHYEVLSQHFYSAFNFVLDEFKETASTHYHKPAIKYPIGLGKNDAPVVELSLDKRKRRNK